MMLLLHKLYSMELKDLGMDEGKKKPAPKREKKSSHKRVKKLNEEARKSNT